MAEITGGQAVHDALVKLGVTHVFGIPSVHNLPTFDAILNGGKITPIITRHEQAAVHAADGYARTTGKLGVALCSTGPGTTNTVTGIYEAAFASSPVLVLTGQNESTDYGKGRAAGHEHENQLPMLQTVARTVGSPKYTKDLAPTVFRVAADIMNGRPQPGAIEMPIDIQYGKTDVPVGEPIEVHPVAPNQAVIDDAVALLGETRRRVIIAGGGVLSGFASGAVQELAENLNAPVFVSGNGRGAIPDDHELAMGSIFNREPTRQALQDTDVVIAIGTRLRGTIATWGSLPGKLVHIDVDPQVHGLVAQADISVIADAKEATRALLNAMNAEPGDGDFLSCLQGVRKEQESNTRERIGSDMAGIMDHIRAGMDRDSVFVRDMTMPAYAWGNEWFPILAPHTTMNPNSGAIGPGLPLANGAAVASGKKTVVIHGDGGVMVHIGELSTAAQHQIPIVLIVFTDGGYGVLRGIQGQMFEGRNIGVDLATPNFATLARGMGVSGEQVKGFEAFKSAFDRAMSVPGPYVIDVDLRTLEAMKGFGKRIEFEQPD
jgi:acetolactate synthase-1/2/3 large subunit